MFGKDKLFESHEEAFWVTYPFIEGIIPKPIAKMLSYSSFIYWVVKKIIKIKLNKPPSDEWKGKYSELIN